MTQTEVGLIDHAVREALRVQWGLVVPEDRDEEMELPAFSEQQLYELGVRIGHELGTAGVHLSGHFLNFVQLRKAVEQYIH